MTDKNKLYTNNGLTQKAHLKYAKPNPKRGGKILSLLYDTSSQNQNPTTRSCTAKGLSKEKEELQNAEVEEK